MARRTRGAAAQAAWPSRPPEVGRSIGAADRRPGSRWPLPGGLSCRGSRLCRVRQWWHVAPPHDARGARRRGRAITSSPCPAGSSSMWRCGRYLARVRAGRKCIHPVDRGGSRAPQPIARWVLGVQTPRPGARGAGRRPSGAQDHVRPHLQVVLGQADAGCDGAARCARCGVLSSGWRCSGARPGHRFALGLVLSGEVEEPPLNAPFSANNVLIWAIPRVLVGGDWRHPV